LAGVLKTILEANSQELPKYLATITPSLQTVAIAQTLLKSENSVLILGEHIVNNLQARNIANLVTEIAKQTNSKTFNVSATANIMGARRANFVPSDVGRNVNDMFKADMRAFMLLDVYPEYDFHNLALAVDVLAKKDVFVISLNSFNNDLVSQYSDVIFPMAAMYETSGTHINIDNKMQSFSAAVNAPNNAKPAWKIIKVLADLLELQGFHYENSTQILDEITHQSACVQKHDTNIDVSKITTKIETIWMHSPYQSDVLLRHSNALQISKIGQINTASMNANTAKELSITNTYLGVPVELDATMADKCIFVSSNQATNTEELV
jgi:NADH-quinone oxidoreductase subunit G